MGIREVTFAGVSSGTPTESGVEVSLLDSSWLVKLLWFVVIVSSWGCCVFVRCAVLDGCVVEIVCVVVVVVKDVGGEEVVEVEVVVWILGVV